jgi:alpha-tubulin suppressor-like RCC1 family protein
VTEEESNRPAPGQTESARSERAPTARALGRKGWLALGAAVSVQAAFWAGCDQILGITEAADGGSSADATGMDGARDGAGEAVPVGDSGLTDQGLTDSPMPDGNCLTPDVGACEGDACIVQLAAGIDFACALRADQSVWCWGGNQYGQLGHKPGTTADEICHLPSTDSGAFCKTTPTQVQLEGGALQVSAGGDFACALSPSGNILCWGRNTFDELGHPSTASEECGAPDPKTPLTICNWNPEPVQSDPSGTPFAVSTSGRVAAGALFACAVSGGNAYCWGFHGSLELGSSVASTAIPVQLPIVGDIVDVATSLGSGTACARLDGGAVWCWGANGSEIVTDSDASCTKDGCPPMEVIPEEGGTVGPAAELRVGGAFACEVSSDGLLGCWGSNYAEELGTSSITESTHAVVASTNWNSARVGVEALALANNTALVRDRCDNVWAWGDNTFGLVSKENFYVPSYAAPSPFLIAFGDASSPTTLLAAGDLFAVARTADNVVWAWGANSYGQLGHAPNTSHDSQRGGMGRYCNEVPQPVPFP